jgi:hypothetical protein
MTQYKYGNCVASLSMISTPCLGAVLLELLELDDDDDDEEDPGGIS